MITKVIDHEYVYLLASGEWFATVTGNRYETKKQAIEATLAWVAMWRR